MKNIKKIYSAAFIPETMRFSLNSTIIEVVNIQKPSVALLKYEKPQNVLFGKSLKKATNSPANIPKIIIVK